jgi:hypothetical protein
MSTRNGTPVNSIVVESESFVPIKSEKREVKYNFILIVLYFQTQNVNEWPYSRIKSDATENNKFVKEHEYSTVFVLTANDTTR